MARATEPVFYSTSSPPAPDKTILIGVENHKSGLLFLYMEIITLGNIKNILSRTRQFTNWFEPCAAQRRLKMPYSILTVW
jgi:hypothetical protein